MGKKIGYVLKISHVGYSEVCRAQHEIVNQEGEGYAHSGQPLEYGRRLLPQFPEQQYQAHHIALDGEVGEKFTMPWAVEHGKDDAGKRNCKSNRSEYVFSLYHKVKYITFSCFMIAKNNRLPSLPFL